MALDLSQKQIDRLKEPYIAKELETIEAMVQIYCRARHGQNSLCPDCKEFIDYARKRLACCPYGSQKPVCQKCKCHCFGGTNKQKVKEVMAFSGPRLIFKRPGLLVRHLIASLRKAPAKPKFSVIKKEKSGPNRPLV